MSIYDFKVQKRKDGELDLAELKGKVLLIVNTATGCGFTPQYEGLEKLYEKYHEQGFEVLDFPCNQFANQAPGDDEEIHEFCTLRYKTQFDQLKKIDVNGENESPLYTYLKEQAPEEEVDGFKNKATMKMVAALSKTTKKTGDIRWNFTKFLVDREGKIVKRYAPVYDADVIEADLIKLL
ncbi:MAG: glutathione peroxidase [Clostridia bacterium]|nr:glutathione peroxidase [Clostridia bacterium]MBQ3870042.1 glutathione peroxidase [Clostridia bacterium]